MVNHKYWITVSLLLLASCTPSKTSPTAGKSDLEKIEPVKVVEAFEASIMGDDIQIPLSYLHENAVISYDYILLDGTSLDQIEISSPLSIKGFIQVRMNDPYQDHTEILRIFNEGETVYFWLEFHYPTRGCAAVDGSAVIKDGKIYRLHYNPQKAYLLYESPNLFPPSSSLPLLVTDSSEE